MAVALATEVAYAKAARLLAELVGIDVSARSVRRDTLSLAPERIGPEVLEVPVPVPLLDGTGVRAGDAETRKENGMGLRLAVGLVARRREGGRVVVEARLLSATLDESWKAMGDLLAGVRPGLVIVDCEEAITDRRGRRRGPTRAKPKDSYPPTRTPRTGSRRRGASCPPTRRLDSVAGEVDE